MTTSDRALEELLDGVDGWLPLSGAELLWKSAREAKTPVVEIGCYRGRSTIALALGVSKALEAGLMVYSVDPHRLHIVVYGRTFARPTSGTFFGPAWLNGPHSLICQVIK